MQKYVVFSHSLRTEKLDLSLERKTSDLTWVCDLRTCVPPVHNKGSYSNLSKHSPGDVLEHVYRLLLGRCLRSGVFEQKQKIILMKRTEANKKVTFIFYFFKVDRKTLFEQNI